MDRNTFTIIIVVLLVIIIILLLRNTIYKSVVGADLTWDLNTNAHILRLAPKVRNIWADSINDLDKNYGIKYRITSSFRSFDEQKILYDKYLAGGFKAAPPGLSYHNYGLATDGLIVVNGSQRYPTTEELNTIVKVFESHGLYWGGHFGDNPHFEYRGFGRESQLLALWNSGQVDGQYLKLVA